MIIVLDTNIIISALIFEKTAAKVIDKIFSSDNRIIISDEVSKEYIDKIASTKFDKYIPVQKRLSSCIDLIDSCVNITPTKTITACRDADDNKFLELAVTGKADYLITGDDDLLCLNPFRGVNILSAAEFLEIT